MVRLWRGKDDLGPVADLEWSPVLAWGTLGLALSFLFVPLLGRVGEPDLGSAAVFAGVAALPWIAELFGRHPKPLPRILCVGVGIGYYAFNPASQEFAPFVMVLAAGEIAATSSRRAGLAATVVFGAIMVAGELSGNYDGSLIWVAGIAFGFVAGAVSQSTLRLYTELNRAQEGLVARAATEERQRIAREVHDVIAHSLAVTMLHVTGARLALERDDRADAVDALAEAERLGRQSLNDVRRTVGLLAGPSGVTAAPEPSAAEIVDLVASYRHAGLDASYSEAGDPTRLSLASGLGLYRIAQESLANVVKHAPGAAAVVELWVDEARATLRVTNDRPRTVTGPAGGEGGRGIAGIKDRAQLLGGSASAGPAGDGWSVEVVVPVDGGEGAGRS